jgi:hypothetical protein
MDARFVVQSSCATRLIDVETDIPWQPSCTFGFETERKGEAAFGAE